MTSNTFTKKHALALALAGSMGAASSGAFASLDALSGNIDSFDVFLGGNNWLNDVNQLNWSGWDLSVFDDGDAPNTTGSKSTDYIVLTMQTGEDVFSDLQSSCLNSTCEVTLVAKTRAEQTDDAGSFVFTDLVDFRIFLDTGIDSTNKASGNNIAEYFDGDLVLTGGPLLSLTGTNPVANTGKLTPEVGAGGSVNLQHQINGTQKDFLFTSGGTQTLFDAFELVFALTDAETTLQALQYAGTAPAFNGTGAQQTANQTVFNNMISYFEIEDSANVSLSLIRNTPQTNLASGSIPEPATLALLGIGLIGVGAARRRSV